MNYKESASYLMEHLKTSVVDSRDTRETIDLLVEVTEVDVTIVKSIVLELEERMRSGETMTARRNAFLALGLITRKHPDLNECKNLISDTDIILFTLAAIRLQE